MLLKFSEEDVEVNTIGELQFVNIEGVNIVCGNMITGSRFVGKEEVKFSNRFAFGILKSEENERIYLIKIFEDYFNLIKEELKIKVSPNIKLFIPGSNYSLSGR